MKPDLRRWMSLARETLRPGGMARLKEKLEDRLMSAVIDATRLTNDGSYRRYRDEPTARGERVPTPGEGDPAAGNADPRGASASLPGEGGPAAGNADPRGASASLPGEGDPAAGNADPRGASASIPGQDEPPVKTLETPGDGSSNPERSDD